MFLHKYYIYDFNVLFKYTSEISSIYYNMASVEFQQNIHFLYQNFNIVKEIMIWHMKFTLLSQKPRFYFELC